MRHMMHITHLFIALLTSSLLRGTTGEARILCAWTKVMSNNEAHYSFLRSDPRQASPSLRLYHSVWSEERTLLSCSWSDDAAVTRSYLSLCRERASEFSDRQDANVDTDSMFAPDGPCVSVISPRDTERPRRRLARSLGARAPSGSPEGQGERSGVERHQRVKRGFIVPGTLWCGSGNKAPSYADLGVFAETDKCCREHDQCKDTILSFQSNFGVFNSNIFTMSHCNCDNKFHSCLMEAKDSISDVVGYTFFNLLKMHCFELSHRLQCAQRNWFGMCKETKMALYAEVHPPTMYETNKPSEVNLTSNASVINATISTQAGLTTEAPQSSTLDLQLFPVLGAASTAPALSPNSTAAFITPTTDTSSTGINTLEEGVASTPGSSNDLENDLPTKDVHSSSHTPKPSPSNGLLLSEPDSTEKQLSCDIYKDLDQCKTKIPPQQNRFGLHNPEPRTLYHCNCTTRLFQSLAEQRELTEVQALLLGHVSPSCFLAQDCTVGKICSAVLVKPGLPQLEERSGGSDMEERRHLQAVRLQVRRPSSKRAKRKERAVRLHKLCLRLTMPTVRRNMRAHGAQRSALRERKLI